MTFHRRFAKGVRQGSIVLVLGCALAATAAACSGEESVGTADNARGGKAGKGGSSGQSGSGGGPTINPEAGLQDLRIEPPTATVFDDCFRYCTAPRRSCRLASKKSRPFIRWLASSACFVIFPRNRSGTSAR